MNTKVKCAVKKYDPERAPCFGFIHLAEFETRKPSHEDDPRGEVFASRLSMMTARKGFQMKFYSHSSDKDYDYDVVIWSDALD